MDYYRPPTTQGTMDALGALYRAVRAWRFYPNGHPTRRSSLELALEALRQLQDGNTLLLACGRSGFSYPDGEFLKDSSGLSAALAFELFVRRARKISFLGDLYQEDLLELLKILCLSPEVIQHSGGIEAMMAERGIRSIWINEFDLSAIRKKRYAVEQSGIIPQGIDESETGGDAAPGIDLSQPEPENSTVEQQLQGLLGKLSACADDDSYLILIRQAVGCVDILRGHQDQQLLISLIELLATHSSDDVRSKTMRESAQFAIEQMVACADVVPMVLDMTEKNGVSGKALLEVLKAGGATAIKLAIELMAGTNNLKTRKTVSTILGQLGEPAVPVLLSLMKDSRWFITRNICAILGAIASHEALPALTGALYHSDLRVRKEAIRSLAQLGGQDAESAILAMLRGADTVLYPQAIASLGGMKSKKSLAELMLILFSKDMFLKSLAVKLDVLAAIALIGERQVTPHLVTLLEERYLLAASRGRQFKIAVAVCLGKLGDVRAVPVLEKLASGGGALGEACSDAIALIEKTEGKPDGNS